MKHAAGEFRERYDALPAPVREAANRSYRLLRHDPRLPALNFKRIGYFWCVRVGLLEDGILWIWIGSHAEYDQMIR